MSGKLVMPGCDSFATVACLKLEKPWVNHYCRHSSYCLIIWYLHREFPANRHLRYDRESTMQHHGTSVLDKHTHMRSLVCIYAFYYIQIKRLTKTLSILFTIKMIFWKVKYIYSNKVNYSERQAWANSVDSDQTPQVWRLNHPRVLRSITWCSVCRTRMVKCPNI